MMAGSGLKTFRLDSLTNQINIRRWPVLGRVWFRRPGVATCPAAAAANFTSNAGLRRREPKGSVGLGAKQHTAGADDVHRHPKPLNASLSGTSGFLMQRNTGSAGTRSAIFAKLGLPMMP